jgi:hypothetical protein
VPRPHRATEKHACKEITTVARKAHQWLNRGDWPLLEELLSRCQARINRYGLRMCGDPEDAKYTNRWIDRLRRAVFKSRIPTIA